MEALLGVSGFLGLLVIGYLVLIIAAIIKFFQMANDVREIKHHLQDRSVSVRVSKQNDSDDFWSSDDNVKSGLEQTASSPGVNEDVELRSRQNIIPL